MQYQHLFKQEDNAFAPQAARYMAPQYAHRRRTEHRNPPENRRQTTAQSMRDPLLLLNAVVGIAWFVLTILQMSSAMRIAAGNAYDAALLEFRTGMSIALQLPSILTAFTGVVLSWISWLTRKRSFALASGILFGAAVLIGLGKPLGYIPFMFLSIISYIRTQKRERT